MSEIKYVLDVDGEKRILPLERAAAQYDCGWAKVKLINVIENERMRSPTSDDYSKLSNAADEYSASK